MDTDYLIRIQDKSAVQTGDKSLNNWLNRVKKACRARWMELGMQRSIPRIRVWTTTLSCVKQRKIEFPCVATAAIQSLGVAYLTLQHHYFRAGKPQALHLQLSSIAFIPNSKTCLCIYIYIYIYIYAIEWLVVYMCASYPTICITWETSGESLCMSAPWH